MIPSFRTQNIDSRGKVEEAEANISKERERDREKKREGMEDWEWNEGREREREKERWNKVCKGIFSPNLVTKKMHLLFKFEQIIFTFHLRQSGKDRKRIIWKPKMLKISN